MSFMEPQVTRAKETWYQVDTQNEGLCSYPARDFTRKQVAEMHGVDPDEVDEVKGYGARLSAHGYIDCTEWTVFDTADEAEAYLEETYGDDEVDETDPDVELCDACSRELEPGQIGKCDDCQTV